jgi:hypothetical protein
MKSMRAWLAVLLPLSAILAGEAHAFESDVRFGLTRWLAVQAGFTPAQADIVATGNRRNDSGMMDTLEFALQYACLGEDDPAASLAQDLHYASERKVPAPPAERAVVKGSDAARKASAAMVKSRPDQAGFLLHKLGESLTPLQDSWSHQGVPGVPDTGYFRCDATRASAHPAERGGWSSHKADQARLWPDDTQAMARATYEVLVAYPPVDKAARQPREWASLQPALAGFVRAATKAEKKAWFTAQGFTDTSFLEGITLPDGKERWTQRWEGHRLPPLARAKSEQRPIEADVLDFFNAFFAEWMSAAKLDAVAAKYGAKGAARGKAGEPSAGRMMEPAEIAARLTAWRLRDHGRVAEIAHSPKALTPAQVAEINRLARDPEAFARYATFNEAFYPLMPKGKDVQALFPFVVAPVAGGPRPRTVAMAKLRHLPYDTIAVVAEKLDAGWAIVGITATVDH